MLLRLGVASFDAWNLGGLALVAAAPACWFLAPHVVRLHLALVACHLGVGLVVARLAYVPPGLLEGDGLYAFALRNWADDPLLAADLVAIGLHFPARSGPALATGIAAVAAAAAFTALAAPAWLAAVPAHLVAQAREQAGADPFCIAVDHRPARGEADLSVKSMTAAAFARGVEHHWYYAVLVVAKRDARPMANWSFTSLRFEPVSPYFAGLNPDCDPAFNPL